MHSNCILDSVANLLVRHMVFVGNVQKSPIASHLKGLMLQVFLVEDPEIEYLFCGAPSGSETMISSACGWSLFRNFFSMTLLGWLMRLMVL